LSPVPRALRHPTAHRTRRRSAPPWRRSS
jgi:hypothetical protein